MKKFIKYLAFIFAFFSILILYSKSSPPLNPNRLYICFLDVGQGDATLIQYGENTLLIDSGPKSSEDKMLKYLKELNLKDIDYLLATHPHEDHIGNMDEIIDTLKVKNFYAPYVTTDSGEFSDLINALNRKNLKINILDENTTSIKLDENISIDILYPYENLNTDNLNNYSPVIKLTFNNTSFLFTGDGEKEVNDYLLYNKYPIDVDVLKLGHHGSKTSLDKDFLDAVTPTLAVASCGYNNSYNHPSSSVIQMLSEDKVKLLRTDLDGSIILSSDGENIYIEK